MARGQYGLSRACPLLHTPLRWMVGARQALAAKELQVPTRYFLDGSWAESRWFPRVVAGSATVFVVAALEAVSQCAYVALADDGAGEVDEGLVGFGVPFVAGSEAAEVVEPCEGPLDDPAAFAKS